MDAYFERMARQTNLEHRSFDRERAYRLERMEALCALWQHPQRQTRAWHVAGSKGKGSTAALLARALSALGDPCGLYTSPHLKDYRERITLDGAWFDEAVYDQAYGPVLEWLDSPEGAAFSEAFPPGPTTFELLTLGAFRTFALAGCGRAVYEVGLGGRLDATNVLRPELSVVTRLEREHTDFLGPLLSGIAREKAGIFKPGVPAVSGTQSPEALIELRRSAQAAGTPLIYVPEKLTLLEQEPAAQGTRLRWRWHEGPEDSLMVGLCGRGQAENAALAAVALREALKDEFWGQREKIYAAWAALRIPGRQDWRPGSPDCLYDVCHTPRSVEDLIAALPSFSGRPWILVVGLVEGKDVEGITRALARQPWAACYVTAPGQFKQSDPARLHRRLEDLNCPARLVSDPLEAEAQALEEGRRRGAAVVFAGSFYLLGSLRSFSTRGSQEASGPRHSATN